MKQFILTVASIAIFLSATMAHAAPQKLPTRGQLIKLIKKTDRAGLGVTGLSSYKYCDKVSINSVKILKIGRASSNYYKESGNYIDSDFMVKLKATGSCSFDSFHQFFSDIDGDGHDDYLSGTLPIINEPLEVDISTDNYGDWKAGTLRFVGNNFKSKRIKQHIKKVFTQGKAAMGGNRYTSRVVINNIRPNQGNGIYHDGFAVSNKTFAERTYKSLGRTDITEIFGASYRAADWYDLENYYANNGNVLALLKRLGISSKEGVYITSRGSGLGKYVAVHCTAFDSNKYFALSKKLNTQPLCLAKSFDVKQSKALAVKKSVYGEEPKSGKKPRLTLQKHSPTASSSSKRSSKPSPALTSFNSNKNASQPATADKKRINEMRLWFKQRPKASKAFYKQSKDVRFRLFQRIYERDTKQERRKVFLNIANSLENGGKQHSTSGSNSHSHGGRIHAHKLPHQGKAHRHNNGAIGR